jgi:hypothetical protein
MDPLSVIGSTVAILQAIGMLVELIGQVKRFRNAPEDINALMEELSCLASALRNLQQIPRTLLLHQSQSLQALLDSCRSMLQSVEDQMKAVLFGLPEGTDVGHRLKFSSLSWMRRKGEIDRVRQRLRNLTTVLALHLAGLNL